MNRGNFDNIVQLVTTYPHGCLAGDWATVGGVRYEWTCAGLCRRDDFCDMKPITEETIKVICTIDNQ